MDDTEEIDKAAHRFNTAQGCRRMVRDCDLAHAEREAGEAFREYARRVEAERS